MWISRRLLMVLPVLPAFALPAFALPAFAQPGGFGRARASEPLMAVLDRDQDGELSEAELKEASQLLRKIDRNRDGQLVRDEIRAFMFDRTGGQPGQRPGGNVGQARNGGGPGAPGSNSLERAGLKVGGPAPDVTVFDAAGGKLSLEALKGSYAVLVFGCLT